ncbi:3-hydroxyacyl-CoA dehydrogenase [Actinocorallia herbida]|uniref:3-hydroxyacyl-CoA dehydrogenase n=1 Tax=Actinocorallia herbida TaxID=58109 RepID=A0A3N1D3C1_9ACTN|nr:3-hydroxyacyl-CoA dehydrogenase family protein [Actinocorallia herbida]ROO88021.1 3-hydroxyacyl-CoA dehydrogenase [Actinocorallia herbida]
MKVAVIGAGTMGAGIAQVCATAGHETSLIDTSSEQLARAEAATRASLERFTAKGTLSAAEAEAVRRRLHPGTDLAAGAAGADVVVETVVEDLEVKRDVFREVVKVAAPDALLGTNTSQLSITAIGAAIPGDTGRVVGLHFFNPPVLMRLVEIVQGVTTDERTIQRAVEFGRGLGKETVVCRKDSPGFLTSRISAIVRLECLRMLEEGVADAEDIDRALRLGLNFPMGPLELGDFNGLDTYLKILTSLEQTLGERFKPTVTLRNLVAAGRLGRKTGHGIYRYDAEGCRISEPESA